MAVHPALEQTVPAEAELAEATAHPVLTEAGPGVRLVPADLLDRPLERR